MHDFTELKNQLCKELDKISAKGELNTQSLDYADKAAHALKCILTVEAMMEEYPSYSGTNGSYRMPGMSYNGNGYSNRRDVRGRYSGTDDYVARLEDLMYSMPDERSRQDIERVISRMRGGM